MSATNGNGHAAVTGYGPERHALAFPYWDRRRLMGQWTVEETVERIVNYKWCEQRLPAALGGWGGRSVAGEGRAKGFAFGRYKNSAAYVALVADVEIGDELRVLSLTGAVDAGLVINPDGVLNQIEGGAIQATSWTLKERVRFDRLNVTSDTWETYPILRFSEVPAIDVEFVAAEGNPSLGVGECAQGPTAAAIGNAVCDALGIRVRSLPLTAEHLIAAMSD